MDKRVFILLGLAFVAFAGMFPGGPVADEHRVVPQLRALRVNSSPPKIDGDLDDAIWNHTDIECATRFTQREPDEGEAATESTHVAVVYDDQALYFAFWCYDSEPEKITRQLVRRDRYSEADYVRVNLDPYHDHQTGYCGHTPEHNIHPLYTGPPHFRIM